MRAFDGTPERDHVLLPTSFPQEFFCVAYGHPLTPTPLPRAGEGLYDLLYDLERDGL